MNGSFTANEVRTESCKQGQLHRQPASDMLNAYADLLEAREKAVPVRQFRVVPKGSTWTDVKDDEIWAAVTAHPESYETRVLYTHSAQAQPPANLEKMPRMEQLRRFVEWERANNPERTHIAEWALRRIAYLEAHPPAARVPVDAVMRVIDGQRRLPYCSIDEKQAFRNELEAALAAQENPNG